MDVKLTEGNTRSTNTKSCMDEKDFRYQRVRELSLDMRNNDLADVRLEDEDAGVRLAQKC